MKKFTRILSFVLVCEMVFLALTSCATKLSGTYKGSASLFGLAGGSIAYKFSGSKVTITTTIEVLGISKDTSFDGTYKITDKDDGTAQITFTFADGEAGSYNGSFTFEQDKKADTISIGGVTYTKVK